VVRVTSGTASSAKLQVRPAARVNDIRPGSPFEAVTKKSLSWV
jgi:hypothetical protein